MSRQKKLIVNSALIVMAIAPIVLYAYEYGPDPGFSTAPGDSATGCISSGCHTGTINSGSGSVKIVASGGNNYTPGVAQQISVTITDAAEKKYGFQLSARVDSSPKTTAAGLLVPGTDGYTQTLCSDGSIATATGCAAKTGGSLEWIEHTLNGYYASATSPSYTYKFTWTPPATNVGTVTFYAAGNAVTGQLLVTGTNTYSTSLQLSPGSGGGGTPPPANTPTISSGGVVSASSFGAFTAAGPGSWIEIYGTNLAASTYTWAGTDFNGSAAPTTINGVKVTVGGQPCSVSYTSSGQIDAQLPANIGPGPQPLVVTNASGSSSPYTLTVNAAEPGFLAPPSFTVSGKQYVAAFNAALSSFIMPPGAISGVTSAYAKPGDTIIIYGVGFGAVTPSSVLDAGQIVGAVNSLANPFTISFGGSPGVVAYYGLAPGYVGLYQFNVAIPQIANNDFVPVTFTLSGTAGTQTLYTAVHN
jgi:uncharacterized protein (TIGR03437 family)